MLHINVTNKHNLSRRGAILEVHSFQDSSTAACVAHLVHLELIELDVVLWSTKVK